MSNKINQKLGLRPQTRPRARVQGAGKDAAARALTSASCPQCGHRYVVENRIHSRLLRMCGFCSHLWEREDTAVAS